MGVCRGLDLLEAESSGVRALGEICVRDERCDQEYSSLASMSSSEISISLLS
jgi:hypothetical protein